MASHTKVFQKGGQDDDVFENMRVLPRQSVQWEICIAETQENQCLHGFQGKFLVFVLSNPSSTLLSEQRKRPSSSASTVKAWSAKTSK
jgi:hypothetical protein